MTKRTGSERAASQGFGRIAAIFALSLCPGLWLLPDPARAEFSLCNQTYDVVNAAVGQFSGEGFGTSGWWTIGPNQCANVIEDPLTSRYIYIFAQDVFGREVLSGTVPMCVAPERFAISGEGDCLARGFLEARFHEVDTQNTSRWTLFIYPPPG